jgi:hypothetical protein
MVRLFAETITFPTPRGGMKSVTCRCRRKSVTKSSACDVPSCDTYQRSSGGVPTKATTVATALSAPAPSRTR